MNRLVPTLVAAGVTLAGRRGRRGAGGPRLQRRLVRHPERAADPPAKNGNRAVRHNRLPSCRATTNRVEAWAIAGYLQADTSTNVDTLVVTTGTYTSNPPHLGPLHGPLR